MLDLFPDTESIAEGELAVGGVGASALAAEFGTRLVVCDRSTLLERREGVPERGAGSLGRLRRQGLAYAAVLRLLASEGLAADVSTLGELEHAGVPGDRLVIHGQERRGASGCGRGRPSSSWTRSTR